MAQTLKESQRIKILDAAKKEFLKKGIPATSLRAIARSADMAVGNIYHYFENKDEIAECLLGPVINNFATVVEEFSQHRVKVFEHPHDIVFSEDVFGSYMSMVAESLANIVEHNRDELLIIVNDEKIYERYSSWLLLLLTQLYSDTNPEFIRSEAQLSMYAQIVTKSILSGIEEAVTFKYNNSISHTEFKIILNTYLQKIFTI